MKLKKMIAPIIITAIYILFNLAYIMICVLTDMPTVVTTILVIILAALNGVIIFVLIERIKEIRSGEEDDLSKY
ncbi:hypothetical protein lbkm_1000 [Lachnospiraceae bacterium KM106-2]|nr:hypothetical protein lbkm_1000 [Lachnospiraceae bacterium KM106-2]